MCPIVRDPLRREHPLELVYFLLSVTSEQNKGAQIMSSRRSGRIRIRVCGFTAYSYSFVTFGNPCHVHS
jgi:hypothetical protein